MAIHDEVPCVECTCTVEYNSKKNKDRKDSPILPQAEPPSTTADNSGWCIGNFAALCHLKG